MRSKLSEDFGANVGVFGVKKRGNVTVVVKGVDFKPALQNPKSRRWG